MANPQTRYTHLDAFDTGRLPVSDIHTLHYEQYGKPDGKPGKPLTFPNKFLE
jgi:proline iminopeptidase